MEDFLSVQHYVNGSNKNIGASINSEIQMCHNFDEIAFISFDEKNFFEKILPSEINCHFLPHIMPPYQKRFTDEQTFDVLFLGHNNKSNIDGINWFIANVLKFIKPEIKIYIGGRVCEYIPDGYPNVTKLGFVENIEEIYKKTRISFCPLLNGTGMKIKVVEAMNFGIPVVCTSRGVDGLPDKNHNGCLVTDDPREFASYINRLYTDESFHQQCAQEVASYASECFSYKRTVKVLDKIFGMEG
jgi:glycosyltransferase involved in cell wall biosynthesis